MPTTAAATTKPRAFLPIILLSSLLLRGHPWDHHGPTEGAGVYTTTGTLTNRGRPPPRLTNSRAPVNNNGFCHPGPPAGSSRLTGEALSPGNRLAIVLLVPALPLLAGCQSPPAVAFTVAPARAEGQPDRLAVTMRIQGAPSKGLELRGFATTGVLKIEDISAAGADGAPIA